MVTSQATPNPFVKKETLSEKRHSLEQEKKGLTSSYESSSFGLLSPYPEIKSSGLTAVKSDLRSDRKAFSEFEPKSKFSPLKDTQGSKRRDSDISLGFSYHESKVSNLSYCSGDRFSGHKIPQCNPLADVKNSERSGGLTTGLIKSPNDPTQNSDSRASSFGRISETMKTQKYQNSIEKQKSSNWIPFSAYSSIPNPSFFTTNSDTSIITEPTSSPFQGLDLSFISRKLFLTKKKIAGLNKKSMT